MHGHPRFSQQVGLTISLEKELQTQIDDLSGKLNARSITSEDAFNQLRNFLQKRPSDERGLLQKILSNNIEIRQKVYPLFLALKELLVEELGNRIRPVASEDDAKKIYQKILNFNFLYQQNILDTTPLVPQKMQIAATDFLRYQISRSNFVANPNNQMLQGYFDICGSYFTKTPEMTSGDLFEFLKVALKLGNKSINIPNLIKLIIDSKPANLNEELNDEGLTLLGLAVIYDDKTLVETLLNQGEHFHEDTLKILDAKEEALKEIYKMLDGIEQGILTPEDLKQHFRPLCNKTFPSLSNFIDIMLNRAQNESVSAIKDDFLPEFKSKLRNIEQTQAEIRKLAEHPLFNGDNFIKCEITRNGQKSDHFVSVERMKVAPLGKGAFGEVFSVRYIPEKLDDPFLIYCRDCPDIRDANNNPTYWIACKNPQRPDDKDFAYEQELVDSLPCDPNANYTNAHSGEIVNGKGQTAKSLMPIILSQFQYYAVDKINAKPKGGNVEDFLKKEIAKDNAETKVSNFFSKRGPEMGKIFVQAYKGMDELHKKVIHHDLALRNILYDKTGAKLNDLGKSVAIGDLRGELQGRVPTDADRLPLRIMSPARCDFLESKRRAKTKDEAEVLQSDVSPASDYYSYRMMLLEWFAAELSTDLKGVQNNLSFGQIWNTMLKFADKPKDLKQFLETEFLGAVKRKTENSPASVKQNMQVLISSFGDYFINVPTKDSELAQDKQNLTEAFKKYYIQLLIGNLSLWQEPADTPKLVEALKVLKSFPLTKADFQTDEQKKLIDLVDQMLNDDTQIDANNIPTFIFHAKTVKQQLLSMPTELEQINKDFQKLERQLKTLHSASDALNSARVLDPTLVKNFDLANVTDLRQSAQALRSKLNDIQIVGSGQEVDAKKNVKAVLLTQIDNYIPLLDDPRFAQAEAKKTILINQVEFSCANRLFQNYQRYVELLALKKTNKFTRIEFATALNLLLSMQEDIKTLKDIGSSPDPLLITQLEKDKKDIWAELGKKDTKYKLVWNEFNAKDNAAITAFVPLPSISNDRKTEQSDALDNLLKACSALLDINSFSMDKLSKQLNTLLLADQNNRNLAPGFDNKPEIQALKNFMEAYEQAQAVFEQDFKIKHIDLKTLLALAALQGKAIDRIDEVKKLANDHQELRIIERIAKDYEKLAEKVVLRTRPRAAQGAIPVDQSLRTTIQLPKTGEGSDPGPADKEALQTFACPPANAPSNVSPANIDDFTKKYADCINIWTESLIQLDQRIMAAPQLTFEKASSKDDVINNIQKDLTYLDKQVTQYVLKDIANCTDLAKRTMAIEFWINVANRCLTYPKVKSVNMASAIFDALEDPATQHLQRSFQCLSADAKYKLKQLENLFSTKHNYGALHQFMAKQPNVIPSLTVYLADLNRLEKRKTRKEAKAGVQVPLASYAPAKKVIHEFIHAQTNSVRMLTRATPSHGDVQHEIQNFQPIPILSATILSLADTEKQNAKVAPQANGVLAPTETKPQIVKEIAPLLNAALKDSADVIAKEKSEVDQPLVTQAFSFESIKNQGVKGFLENSFQILGIPIANPGEEAVENFVTFSDSIFDSISTAQPLAKVMAVLYNLEASKKKIPDNASDLDSLNKIQICKDILDQLSAEDLKRLELLFGANPDLRKIFPAPVRVHFNELTSIEHFDQYPTKLDLGKRLAERHSKMDDYVFKQKKSGGKTDSGEEGGLYTIQYYAPNPGETGGPLHLHTQTILFKQERKEVRGEMQTHYANVMAEDLAGAIKNELAGDSTTTVFLAYAPGKDGQTNELYVGSIYYDAFKEMFKHMNLEGRFHTIFGKQFVAGTEVRYQDELTAAISETDKDGDLVCRFADFNKVVAACLIAGDFDFNVGNAGTVLTNNTDKERLVDIDHGAGLHKLLKKLHMHSLTDHLPGKGPNNHFYNLPRELKISGSFADTLDEDAKKDLTPLIIKKIDEYAAKYDTEKLLEFAKYLGMNTKSYKAPLNKMQIATDMKKYLSETFTSRMESARELANEIRLSLCLTKNASGNWELKDTVDYKDEEGNRKQFNLMDKILDRPEYFLTGEYHFRARDQAWNFLNTGIRIQRFERSKLTEEVNKYIVNKIPEFVEHAKNHLNPKFLEYVIANENVYKMLEKNPGKMTCICDGYQQILKDIAKQLQSASRQAYLTHDETIRRNINENITARVCNDIMSEKSSKNRSLVFERWIRIMTECYANKDFNSVLAILSAFRTEPIKDLKTNFDQLPEMEQNILFKMKELFCNAAGELDDIKIADFMLYEMDKEKHQFELAEDARTIAKAVRAPSSLEVDAPKLTVIPSVDYLEKRLNVDMQNRRNPFNNREYDNDKLESLHENSYHRNLIATAQDGEFSEDNKEKSLAGNLTYEHLSKNPPDLKKETFDGKALERETARSNHFGKSNPTFSDKIPLSIKKQDLPKRRTAKAPKDDFAQLRTVHDEVEELRRLCQLVAKDLGTLSEQTKILDTPAARQQSLFAHSVTTLIPGGAPVIREKPVVEKT